MLVGTKNEKGENLFPDIAGNGRLVLLDEIRPEVALSIPWNRDLGLPETGFEVSRAVPVTAVISLFVVSM